MQSKAGLPDDLTQALRQSALATGLFQPSGGGNDLRFEPSRWLNDDQLDAFLGWLSEAASAIRNTQPKAGGLSAALTVSKSPTGSAQSGEGSWTENETNKLEAPR
jgi:hypothetical protein